MRVGVAYAEHGASEPFSVELGYALEEAKLDNVDTFALNPRAVVEGRRFIDTNLTFAEPDPTSPVYESRQAAAAIEWASKGNFDLILNPHSSVYSNHNAAYLPQYAGRLVVSATKYMLFEDIIIDDSPVYRRRMPNMLSFDVGENTDNPMRNITSWVREIDDMANGDDLEDYLGVKPIRVWQQVKIVDLIDYGSDADQVREELRHRPMGAGPVLLEPNELIRFGLESELGCLQYGAQGITWGEHFLDDGAVGVVVVPASFDVAHRFGPGILTNDGQRANG